MDKIDNFEQEPYKFLSNFYEHDSWTVENFYQAAKTDDPIWIAKILTAPHPAIAKKLGRVAPIREGWEAQKIAVMRVLLWCKFNSVLAWRLLETGDAELVEGNDWGDVFWGQVNGVGENWLGRLLVETREAVKAAMELHKNDDNGS